MIECLPSKSEYLNSNPSTAKEREGGKREKGEREVCVKS
jgi:hypothetical protein